MAPAVTGTADRAAVESAPESPALTAGESSQVDSETVAEKEAEKEKEQA